MKNIISEGDRVVMNGKHYVSPEHENKIFTVTAGGGHCGSMPAVYLEGFDWYPVDGLSLTASCHLEGPIGVIEYLEDKAIRLHHRLEQFMDTHSITCLEDVYQRDSVNESCVDLVAELVEIMLEE